jgi:group II intron reverse transcriptase/maturase
MTALLHHVTVDLLRAGYMALARQAAPGVDGVTWRAYGENLEAKLAQLHERVQSGRYRAMPSRRIYLPKPDGRKRPIGIAAVEDKIVQQAVRWVLEAIWEGQFANFSYGFRPGRGAHGALDALYVAITERKVNFVLDADIRSFFDTLDHGHLMHFIEQRVADPRLLRLLRKWLRAGVSEEGRWTPTTVGTPQGAVISPLLANIYLHYVLDTYVKRWRRSEARGEVYIVRYADDFVMGFQYREDAERFRRALEERFARFGLRIHDEKTRLIEFGRFAASNRARRGKGKPETFDFLGFTHIGATQRNNGQFTVRRQPVAKRLRAKLKEIKEHLLRCRHDPVPEQGRWLRAVVQGYFNYFAVPGTARVMNTFRGRVARYWMRALRRRSQKGRLTWARLKGWIARWIPPTRIVHPYPNQRLWLRPEVRAV